MTRIGRIGADLIRLNLSHPLKISVLCSSRFQRSLLYN